MKRILLTQDKFALVDDEDYGLLNQYKWCAQKRGNVFYAARSFNHRIVFMHREILGFQKGDGKITDHIDGNGLNNQRSNLRSCTHQQNCMNVEKAQDKSSIYKGVCFCKRDRKWRATIKFDNKTIHLGRFNSEIEAAKAYDGKAKELFGEFAKLNEEIYLSGNN